MTLLTFLALTMTASTTTLHPLLEADLPTMNAAWFTQGHPNVAMVNVYCQTSRRGDIARIITRDGGVIRSRLRSIPVLTCEMPLASLPRISAMDGVRWIEPALVPLQPLMNSVRPSVGLDVLHGPDWSLTGQGQRVAIVETGLPDANHADFLGRLHAWTTASTDGHATHVAGIMSGDGASSGGTWTGAAPAAAIDAYAISGIDDYFFYTDPGTLENLYESDQNDRRAVAFNQSLGSNVQQNGYPCSLHGAYGTTSAMLDAIVGGSLGQPVTSVWAAGNERAWNICDYDYGTIGPPAAAKNIISVGAVYSDSLNVALFSSWGPTLDGRLKPEIVAPGSQLSDDFGVTACKAGGGYETRSGTSMAAPIVTGTIAALAQAHDVAWPGESRPLPSTWKVILCHSAIDLNSTGPDYRTGYGLLDAPAAAALVQNHDWFEAAVTHGAIAEYAIEVDDSNSPLRVTLAWDDPPAVPNQAQTLEHDLDVLLIAPDGAVHYPWTLNPANPTHAASRHAADHRNPLEQAVVDTPDVGMWRVAVMGISINNPAGQTFSLVSTPPMARTLLQIEPIAQYGTHWQKTPIEIHIESTGETIVDGSVLLHTAVDGVDLPAVSLKQVDSATWQGSLPAAGCGSSIEYWIEATGSLSGAHYLPANAPTETLEHPIGDDETTLVENNFDSDEGWTVSSTAAHGIWERAIPDSDCESYGAPPADAQSDSSGCMLTGPGSGWACDNVDWGCTWLYSPEIDASSDGITVSYARWFSNTSCGHYLDDSFYVDFSIDQGQNWILLDEVDEGAPEADGGWNTVTISLDDVPGFDPTPTLQFRFEACDLGSSTCIEAAVDAFSMTGMACLGLCREDIFGADGQVDIQDLLQFIAVYGTADRAGDLNDNGLADIDDLLSLMAAWGSCQ